MPDFSEKELAIGADEKLSAPPDFKGPTSKRDVTDPFCSFLLIIAWACFLGVGFWAHSNGNAEKLVHPSDYKGRLCGYDNDENGALLAPYWAPTDYLANGVCIDSCSNVTNVIPSSRSELVCKDDADILAMEGCTTLSGGSMPESVEILVVCGACLYQIESVEGLNYCVPSPSTVTEVLVKIDSTAQSLGLGSFTEEYTQQYIPWFQQFTSDLWTARKVILGVGFGGSTVLGFIFLIVLRIPGLVAGTIWMSMLLLPVMLAVGGYYCTVVAANYQNELLAISTFDVAQGLTYGSYGLYIIAACIVLALFFLRKRLYLAIAITKVAGRSVVAIPLSVVYPLVQLTGYVAFLLPCLAVLALLGTTGKSTETTTEVYGFAINYNTYRFPDGAIYGFWYVIFIQLWTSQFIIAMGQITLALCFSKWYFTVNKDGGIGTTLIGAMFVTLWKHTGTAAFGSLMVAIVQFVRTILLYAKRKVKEAGVNNGCTNMLFCCCQCTLGIIQKCLQYLNKNAYIQTALFGYPLCKASREAVFLVARNAFRMAAIGIVSTVSMVFCRLFIVAGVSLTAFYTMQEVYGQEIFSIMAVMLAVSVISWYIASMFTGVLSMAVSTILMSFLVDEEMFGDLGGSQYVPSELKDFLSQLEVDDDLVLKETRSEDS